MERKTIWKRVAELLSDTVTNIIHMTNPGLEPEMRVSMPNLYAQINSKLYELEDWYWLIDAYIDETTKNIYCVVVKNGLLYKADVTLDTSGVTIGAFVQVTELFQPVTQMRFMVRRQVEGPIRWFLISSTAVLNRNGVIDSTELQDNLIKRSVDSGKYPYLTFYHLPVFRMGMTDWVARDEFLLLASGTYDDNNQVAEAMQKAYALDPDYWGSSISFWPFKGHSEEIAENVIVTVYTDGEFEEISIAPEKMACCILTALKSEERINNMDEKMKEAIKKLAGDDSELAEKFIKLAEGANEEIVKQDMVRRTAAEEPSTEETTTQPKSATPPTEEPVKSEEEETEEKVIVNEEVVEAILIKADLSVKISEGISSAMVPVLEAVEKFNQLARDFGEFRSATQAASNKFHDALAQMKTAQEKAAKDLDNEMPRNISTRVTYRPSGKTIQTENSNTKPDAAVIAEDTLSKIK